MDTTKYARLICHGSCRDFVEPIGKSKERFLTKEQYNYQMDNPDKPWRCPDCGEYPCSFDDEYWEKNMGIL